MTIERIIGLGCPADLAPLALTALDAIRNYDGAPVTEARKELALGDSLRSFNDPIWDGQTPGSWIPQASYDFAHALRKHNP